MTKLSAIILTKNSEELLADCIDSLAFCDEVIVIDDTSTDRTHDLAQRMGAKVFEFTSKSFADKRNFGIKKAKNKWVLYIDVDERVTDELRQAIELAVLTKEYVAYRVQRRNFYFGDHEWPAIETMERLFNKNAFIEWHGNVHETAKVDGNIGELEGILNHFTHRDLTSMVAKTVEWSEIEASLRYNANHPRMSWWRFYRVMFTSFYNSYITQKGYKAGTAGLVESLYQMFSMFITYARLWEMQQKKV